MLRLRDVGHRDRHLGRDDDQRLETWPSAAAVVMLREGSRFVMLWVENRNGLDDVASGRKIR
jgi:hypothetical protein